MQKGLTVDAIGSDALPLRRETDARNEVIVAVGGAFAEAAKSAVTKRPDEVVEESVEPFNSEALENLNDVERACLESMKKDFDRGIVLVDPRDEDGNLIAMNDVAFKGALEKDKTAGQSWETVQGRLLANEAALLKKAVELSQLTGDKEGKGACLVGVYENGELAIKQRTQEIVNARWERDWNDGESDTGELKLLFHPEAIAQETGRWAKAVEILRAVKAAGYHVPADAPDYNKRGLVAACEAVTGADYVASPNRDELRDAMLECPDDVADKARVRVVLFNPDVGGAYVSGGGAYARGGVRGVVLWLRG